MDDRSVEQAAPPDSAVQGLVRHDGAQIAPFVGVESPAIRELLRVAIETVQLSTEWEYHFAAPKRATWVGEGLAWAEREFNQLGRDGWELVGFLEHGTAVFKRRLARP